MASNPLDRKGRKQRWLNARKADGLYNRNLLQIARQVSAILQGFMPIQGDVLDPTGAQKTLLQYAELIEPWANTVASYMLTDVSRRNEKAWREAGNEIGRELRHVIKQTPIGMEYRKLLAGNVKLIQSIPREAAQRVHEQVQENMFASTRSTELAKVLAENQNIPKWRAKLIARTETSRASTTLTQVRAMAIGSEGYVWRSSRDGDVRPTHVEQDGKYILWSTPPKTDKSLAPYHAGCGPNCRCWPEPIFPDY